ncbi:hypothetical protein N7495_001570 [Penicillium taxi]|uniref:uncharacterized protein n=1 Tax=Penicillium taxi TaxID=168475 RepID=UPI002544D591|nr:uncharacterized protein N7495_001570 [Penicillium taxi]KAJ5908888.1 hypothetical protein N7495_001570 [Penicillium taxi]
MLGRLLSTAASSLNPSAYSSRNNGTPLESVTEEEHTSGLLFPDVNLLRRSNIHAHPLQASFNSPNASNAGGYDDRGGMELDPVKDFRVIVAQNALGDRDACVLLDTRATPEPSPTGLGIDSQGLDPFGARHARTISSISRGPRRNLNSIQSSINEPSPLSSAADARRSSPASPGAFSRARGRSSTLAPAGVLHEPGYRHSTDSNDTGLLNCIFGSSAFSYRGSSTKMHIISADQDPGTAPTSSPAARSPLARAYTTGSPSGPTRVSDSRPPAKVTVLVTRMFSVNLPEGSEASADRHDYASALYQESLPELGFPFPDVSKGKKIKEKKTPMYAVAITIQIPLLARNTSRPVSRFSTLSPDSPRTGLSSSLDSDYRWPGSHLEDSLSAASPPASLDERLDLLVDHWDVITRTLSHLETLARNEILFLLRKVDSLSGPHPKPAKPPNMQRTNQTIVHLPANILAVNSKLKEEAFRSTRRISLALQTPYVVTGQNRWGVWREEGRSIVRGLGDKEQNFFFLVLLTAFLGNHTEWLNSLGPDWYRRRHTQQTKSQQDTDPMLTHRTVIICPNKMTARRLVFLLSAFIPSKQRLDPLPSPLRPGTSASMRAISQSPPGVPLLRQESLRRAIERRARVQRLNLGDEQRHRSVSVSSQDTTQRSSDGIDLLPPTDFAWTRRASDARSIKTLSTVKDNRAKATTTTTTTTSGATTSVITQSSTVPVPHFTSQTSRTSQTEFDRSDSNGNESRASENLLKSLQRSDSSASAMVTHGGMTAAGGRWGGLFSGLWSSGREPTFDRNEEYYPTSDARKRSIATIAGPTARGPTTLSQMVADVKEHEAEHRPDTAPSGNILIPAATAGSPHNCEDNSPEPSSLTSQVRDQPLRMSVRAEDGVIDVDLPLPGFLSLSSSGDSTIASPRKTRTSVTSMDAMTSYSSGSGFHGTVKETDGPSTHVAGWLKIFHEDFSLQAVRPYASVEADIRRAMRAEPTPYSVSTPDAEGTERWVDVATTLIADTRTSSVKRLRLRRKIIVGRHNGTLNSPISPTPGILDNGRGSVGTSASSQFTSFFSGQSKTPDVPILDGQDPNYVEERFTEEPVMDLDTILVDAVERVLGSSGYSSLAHSRAPSPNRTRRGEDKGQTALRAEEPIPVEVPRTECRKIVLGALEEVVRVVTAEHYREDVDSELGIADRERRRALAGADNTLREGIRKWLLDVEESW